MKKHYTYPRYLIGCAIAVAATVIALVLGVGNVLGWQRTEATVLGKENATVTIEYVDLEGTTHTNVPMGSSFAGKPGSTMLIRYKTSQPEQVEALGINIILGCAVGMAAIMLGALAVIFLRMETKEQKGKEAALANGHPVECRILSVQSEPTLRYGKESHYVRLDCVPVDLEGADPEDIVIYTSERFVNPHREVQGTVTVLVANDDPQKYYVDLDTIKLDEAPAEEPQEDPFI